ncbi:hypothetical protein C789_1847 [Microcystis aeruginosa FACHB-905 = DIANCHI905]|nr:hypothetical protein C789_1847 [Microcystis aeruginosa FACHB-905 = DIANCHI905]
MDKTFRLFFPQKVPAIAGIGGKIPGLFRTFNPLTDGVLAILGSPHTPQDDRLIPLISVIFGFQRGKIKLEWGGVP